MKPGPKQLARHLRPVRRPGFTVPPKWRRIGVRLSRQIGVCKIAFIFDVAHQTVSRWRSRAILEESPHE